MAQFQDTGRSIARAARIGRGIATCSVAPAPTPKVISGRRQTVLPSKTKLSCRGPDAADLLTARPHHGLLRASDEEHHRAFEQHHGRLLLDGRERNAKLGRGGDGQNGWLAAQPTCTYTHRTSANPKCHQALFDPEEYFMRSGLHQRELIRQRRSPVAQPTGANKTFSQRSCRSRRCSCRSSVTGIARQPGPAWLSAHHLFLVRQHRPVGRAPVAERRRADDRKSVHPCDRQQVELAKTN